MKFQVLVIKSQTRCNYDSAKNRGIALIERFSPIIQKRREWRSILNYLLPYHNNIRDNLIIEVVELHQEKISLEGNSVFKDKIILSDSSIGILLKDGDSCYFITLGPDWMYLFNDVWMSIWKAYNGVYIWHKNNDLENGDLNIISPTNHY